ncbi:MAG TPA: aldolase/citrate lyase family protein [Nitrospirota bacterium]|nr:aldolase/citrate lyase family protein [Nitrospirota bacterium]
MNNNLKVRLKKGERVLGTMVSLFDHPEIAKIIKLCGFDYFIVDCEHGNFDYTTVARIMTVARESDICGMVRIPDIRREVILKYMDMGAGGLLLPNTETVEQARALVEYAKYAPLGNRGVQLFRGHTGFEKIANATDYMKKANEETVLLIQIESPTGVKNIDALLAVDGIDAAFIGPNDLSQSMGIMGQFDHPNFIAALDAIIAAAKRKQKFSGAHFQVANALKPWIAKGMTVNLWANETVMMMNAAKDGITMLKG